MPTRLRRLFTCLLLLCLPLQAVAAVAGAACMQPGKCPLQISQSMADMVDCEHHAADSNGSVTHASCSMDHCPLLAAPALLLNDSAVMANVSRDRHLQPPAMRFASTEVDGLLRPPRLSA